MATDGFVRLPNWLLDDSDLSLHELAVYIVLLRFRDPKTGICFPGMATIADRARISRESVKRTIPLLEKKGMVNVRRRRKGTKNLPNEYEVALANETPQFSWADSAKGSRIPKRQMHVAFDTDDSQDDSDEVGESWGNDEGRHSETLPRHSETPGVGTPSAPKKIQSTRSNEQALTHTPGRVHELFSFDVDENTATDKQVAYLKDLATHLSYGSTGGTPKDAQLKRWAKLTRPEATQQIRRYLKELGRPDDIYYPEYGTPEYEALSEAGREFADTAGMPDSVWEYGFALKENS